jgi:transposase-like protein
MAEIVLDSSQFHHQAPEQMSEPQPRLEIERRSVIADNESKTSQFRVKVGDVYYGWFTDTPSNRKAVVVFLREMYDGKTGKQVFTEAGLAQLFGSIHRQAVDGHMKGFREAGGKILDYLKRKRKVDDEVVDLVWQEFCADPYRSLSDLTARVNAEYSGEKSLNEANVREAFSQISGYNIWRKMLKGLESGQARYEQGFLIEHLLDLLSEQSDGSEEVPALPEGLDVSELRGTAVHGESLLTSVRVSKFLNEQLEAIFSPCADTDSLCKQLSGAWEGTSGMLLLAFVLYSSGLSYAVIGGWVGVDASTICRWLEPFSAWGWIWLQQQQFSFSGQVAVDEKHIKIGGVTWYLFVAVDSVTRMPLHINFYPSNGEWYCRTFLLELKAKGYRPYVIVTDGWDAYIKAIQKAFPHAQHQLCRFHLLHSVFRRMKEIKLFNVEVSAMIGNLFHTSDPRTVRRRLGALTETLSKLGKTWVVEGLSAKLEQVLPAVGNPGRWPSTSNTAEWFFRDFERLVYLRKGPFHDEKSARKLTGLFVLGYVFRLGLAGQASPLERTQTDVSLIPFYHLLNRPKLSKLPELIAEQYLDVDSGGQENASA